MLELFINTMKTEHKTIEYVQSRLRSASDIYKKGGQVVMVKKDQLFRMHFYNRRVLQGETSIPPAVEMLMDSLPLPEIKVGANFRGISNTLPFVNLLLSSPIIGTPLFLSNTVLFRIPYYLYP
jgi:hypothetical protein